MKYYVVTGLPSHYFGKGRVLFFVFGIGKFYTLFVDTTIGYFSIVVMDTKLDVEQNPAGHNTIITCR